MRRILIIDNQYTQYQMICTKLSGYEVYPKPEEYSKVMNWIRINLNSRYRSERRDTVFELLENYITGNKIDLFIIDYKLSGSHDGRNGIFIASRLVAGKFKGFPIIFLSRTPEKSHEVQRELLDVKSMTSCIWVEKGYAGISLTEEPYFKKYILDEIPKLQPPSEAEVYLEKVKELRKADQMGPITSKLIEYQNSIENEKSISHSLKLTIDQLYQYIDKTVGETELRRIIKNHHNE